MKSPLNSNKIALGAFATAAMLCVALVATPSMAADKPVDVAALQKEMQYIFNTLLFLIGGFLVMWMAAGCAMLEAGMVRTKNVAMEQCRRCNEFTLICENEKPKKTGKIHKSS